MRKLINTAITTAALITIAGGTAVLGQSHFAAPTMTVHTLSVHAGHDGRARPAHAPLFTS